MTSRKQVEANRRNAKKSTGPNTADGKRRSAKNSIKHGLFANEIVLDGPEHGESRDEFQQLQVSTLGG